LGAAAAFGTAVFDAAALDAAAGVSFAFDLAGAAFFAGGGAAAAGAGRLRSSTGILMEGLLYVLGRMSEWNCAVLEADVRGLYQGSAQARERSELRAPQCLGKQQQQIYVAIQPRNTRRIIQHIMLHVELGYIVCTHIQVATATNCGAVDVVAFERGVLSLFAECTSHCNCRQWAQQRDVVGH
jgi:hypothetical protein